MNPKIANQLFTQNGVLDSLGYCIDPQKAGKVLGFTEFNMISYRASRSPDKTVIRPDRRALSAAVLILSHDTKCNQIINFQQIILTLASKDITIIRNIYYKGFL